MSKMCGTGTPNSENFRFTSRKVGSAQEQNSCIVQSGRVLAVYRTIFKPKQHPERHTCERFASHLKQAEATIIEQERIACAEDS
jgi:hypothetical protein